jgi:hypothetical protein
MANGSGNGSAGRVNELKLSLTSIFKQCGCKHPKRSKREKKERDKQNGSAPALPELICTLAPIKNSHCILVNGTRVGRTIEEYAELAVKHGWERMFDIILDEVLFKMRDVDEQTFMNLFNRMNRLKDTNGFSTNSVFFERAAAAHP